MEQLKEFMLLFRFEPRQEPPTQEQLNQMQKQWGDFISNIAMQGKLVGTYQLGFVGRQISADLSINEGIHISQNETMSGIMVLKAVTIDEALILTKKCPILLMGGTVEVRDIIPMNH